VLTQDAMTTAITPLAAADKHTNVKQRGSLKTKRSEIDPAERLPKPNWIRVKTGSSERFLEIKDLVRANKLVTVCEEASCPNIGECWSKGTATFMIMGDKCTRRCRFCNVSTGRPNSLDPKEPERLAQTIVLMKLNYVVITSVDRDELRDGGAGHFVECIQQIRALTPNAYIEILQVLRAHDVNMLTLGQYLQPSAGHMPVRRYLHPDTFKMYAEEAYKMGFRHAASRPMVHSSYHADEQAHAAGVV
jgi:lipoate synthase